MYSDIGRRRPKVMHSRTSFLQDTDFLQAHSECLSKIPFLTKMDFKRDLPLIPKQCISRFAGEGGVGLAEWTGVKIAPTIPGVGDGGLVMDRYSVHLAHRTTLRLQG